MQVETKLEDREKEWFQRHEEELATMRAEAAGLSGYLQANALEKLSRFEAAHNAWLQTRNRNTLGEEVRAAMERSRAYVATVHFFHELKQDTFPCSAEASLVLTKDKEILDRQREEDDRTVRKGRRHPSGRRLCTGG